MEPPSLSLPPPSLSLSPPSLSLSPPRTTLSLSPSLPSLTLFLGPPSLLLSRPNVITTAFADPSPLRFSFRPAVVHFFVRSRERMVSWSLVNQEKNGKPSFKKQFRPSGRGRETEEEERILPSMNKIKTTEVHAMFKIGEIHQSRESRK